MEILEAIQKLAKAFGLEIQLLFAGLMGGFISTSKQKKMKTTDKIVAMISGALIANYVTPIIADWMNIGENTQYGTAFLMGYMGLKGVEMTIDTIRTKLSKKE